MNTKMLLMLMYPQLMNSPLGMMMMMGNMSMNTLLMLMMMGGMNTSSSSGVPLQYASTAGSLGNLTGSLLPLMLMSGKKRSYRRRRTYRRSSGSSYINGVIKGMTARG